MEESILTSTKKILGLAEEYTAFDLDIITHINAAFSILDQIGAGPAGVGGNSGVYAIDSKEYLWGDVDVPVEQRQLIRTWMFLKVKLWFDPPGTGFLVDAANRQIEQMEFRLHVMGENHRREEEAAAAALLASEEVIT